MPGEPACAHSPSFLQEQGFRNLLGPWWVRSPGTPSTVSREHGFEKLGKAPVTGARGPGGP